MKLLLFVAVLALGCGSKKKPDDKENAPPTPGSNLGPTDLKACDDPPKSKACDHINCGANSALINAFPLNGFRPNGDCNEDRMQLVPKSMDGEKCKGMTLDIAGDKLVGTDGTNKCEGIDLEGASFEIRSATGSERITIAEVTEYTAENGKKFPAYRMEWKHNNGTKTALCEKGGQKLRDKLGVEAMKFSDDLPNPEKELVIPIVSELYDDDGAAIAKPRPWWQDKTKIEWNHLACVDDALAKRSINGQFKPSDPAFSRAALRMWTADYCGGRPFTMRGRMFAWGNDPKLPIEAQWTENGASCLTKPRIIFNNGNEEAPKKTTKLLDKFCAASGKDCKLAQTWIDEAKNCTKPPDGNSTSPTDHVLPDCKPCTGSSCELQSQNVK